jgi:hypothetical protein
VSMEEDGDDSEVFAEVEDICRLVWKDSIEEL